MVFLNTMNLPSVVLLDTIQQSPLMVVILDTKELSIMSILDIVRPKIYGILDAMVGSYTKIWPSVNGTITDLKYGI